MAVKHVAASVADDYANNFPTSRALYDQALKLMPSGVNHDIRWIEPFPVYIERAQGSRKWDVDGNELIDYALGHGALILGHSHPAVLKAIQDQVAAVTHASAPTPIEVRWAEYVHRLVPNADRVRFVLSGTEATMLAMRLARAHTGRTVIVRVRGHFHGWHDYNMFGWVPPWDVPGSAGVPEEIASTMRTVPLNDIDAVEEAVGRGDVAGVILEPNGPVVGTVPVQPGYLERIREITSHHGAALIFDEVVTGFRLAPGGAQQFFGVNADLVTFAKAIAGGMPAGAVAGRAEIMSLVAYRHDPEWNRHGRVVHLGTYSGHPVGAAAGTAALELLADGSAQDHAASMADRLRAGLNDVIRGESVAGCAYGLRSCFRLTLGDSNDLPMTTDPDEFIRGVPPERLLVGTRQPLRWAIQKALLLEGVDFLAGNHGWLSLAHTPEDVDKTVLSFERALSKVIADGTLSPHRSGHR